MKVILVNGSPKINGCTFTALSEVAAALNKCGVETEIFHIGAKPISGCLACGYCRTNNKCVVNDAVNEFGKIIENADGFVFGSPVHYASASGAISSFMDRLFYASGNQFKGKPAAAVVSCRRAGSTAALDQLNKYFTISQMPVVSSVYWNMVHGHTPAEVMFDEEGLQVMRTLGNNMAWLLKCIDLGKVAGYPFPKNEPRIMTNFVR
jgi:multimeric flavodoxin WrbA